MEELVGLVASIAGDPHRSYLRIRANPIKKEYFAHMQRIVDRVGHEYRRHVQGSEVVVQPDAAATVITWMESHNWLDFTGYLRLGGVCEGDAARLISQCADHLHQISRLKDSHPELALQAEEGRRILLRPPLADAYEDLLTTDTLQQDGHTG